MTNDIIGSIIAVGGMGLIALLVCWGVSRK